MVSSIIYRTAERPPVERGICRSRRWFCSRFGRISSGLFGGLFSRLFGRLLRGFFSGFFSGLFGWLFGRFLGGRISRSFRLLRFGGHRRAGLLHRALLYGALLNGGDRCAFRSGSTSSALRESLQQIASVKRLQRKRENRQQADGRGREALFRQKHSEWAPEKSFQAGPFMLLSSQPGFNDFQTGVGNRNGAADRWSKHP